VYVSSGDGSLHMGSRKYTNATTYSADYALISAISRVSPLVLWLRIADNGTNRICSFSMDGENFIDFHSIGRTDFLTADEVGFFIDPYDGAATMTLLSWAQA
jgi:hypothetical protein